jgi:tetratricopeptide (TPR) repeat protein
VELGNKDSLQRTYGNQALILKAWGRLEEAMALHKKQEALCLELGLKSSLGYCYWGWGLLAREMGDMVTFKEKLNIAVQIFDKLKMKKQLQEVQQELNGMTEPTRFAKNRGSVSHKLRKFVAGLFGNK